MDALRLLSCFGDKLQFELIYPQDLLDKKLKGLEEKEFQETLKKHKPKRMFGRFELLERTLKRMNDNNWGVYFTVNELNSQSQRKDVNFKKARAVWIEDDGETKNGLTDPSVFPLAPSSIVESSPGKFHYYWFTSVEDADEWQQVMNGMCDKYGGDKGGKLKVQVLRVPGFKNTKAQYGGAALVTIRGGNFKQYDWSIVKEHFPPQVEITSEEVGTGVASVEIRDSISEILSGESIYPNVLRLSASLVVKRVNRKDVHEILSAVIDHADADEARKTATKIKLWKTIDDAIVKFSSSKKYDHSDSLGLPYTKLDWPPGFVGDVARWINSTMQYPSPEIAIASAFHVVSVLGGGCYHFEGLSVARSRTILGENGRGKQTAADSVKRIMTSLPLQGIVEDFVMRESHSPYNYQRDMNLHKVRGMINSEAGIVQSSAAGDQANKAAWKLKALSQQIGGDTLGVIELSKGNAKNNVEVVLPVQDPIFILLDESTPETYLPMALKSLHIENGAMARSELYFIGPEEYYNEDAFKNKKVPEEFVTKFSAMVNQFREANVSDGLDPRCTSRMIHVDMSAVGGLIMEMKHKNVEGRQKSSGKPMERATLVRYVEKVIATTMILAIADSVDVKSTTPKRPVASKEHFEYAVQMQDELNRAILANGQSGNMATIMDRAMDRLYKCLCDMSDKDVRYLSKDGYVTMQWLVRKFRSNETIMRGLVEQYRWGNHQARMKLMEEAVDRGMVVRIPGSIEQWKSLV